LSAEEKLFQRRKTIFNVMEENKIPLDLATALNFLVIAGEILGLLDQDILRAMRLLENAYNSKVGKLNLRFLFREERKINETESEWINWDEVNFYIFECGFDGVVFSRCSCPNENCIEKGIFYLKCGHHTHEGHTYKILNLECPKCIFERAFRAYFERRAEYMQ